MPSAMQRPRLLIVDDHDDIRLPLATYLERYDFAVNTLGDGATLREHLQNETYQLIILDIMLPGESGLSLCRFIAEHYGTPVILLTALTEQADRIAGLEIGADDYVVKPFDPRELVARIRSVLRRHLPRAPAAPVAVIPNTTELRFHFCGWQLDTRTRALQDDTGNPIPLSTAEFHLLRVLLEHAGRVLSRNQLLDLTQRSDTLNFDRSIDSQISRLRKKLESDSRNPAVLKTVRGDGYLFATKVTVEPA